MNETMVIRGGRGSMVHNPARIIESYVHGQRIGVLAEFEISSVFSASSPQVLEFCKDVTLQIAAGDPDDIDGLLSQGFIKDPDKLIKDMIQGISEAVSAEITIIRFVRWESSKEIGDSTEPL